MYTARYKSHHDASRSLKKKFTLQIDKEDYLRTKLAQPTDESLVLYLHVPFCNKVCSFCPFHRPDKLRRRTYHEYLLEQIDLIKDLPYMRSTVNAINFGGGTPTALTPLQMDIVLSKLHESFNISKDAEISLESSATELSDEMLDVLVKNKVNRLSIGVQTFQDETRQLFGRRGSGEHAAARIKRALDYGITNTNIDLIYHYPGQTENMLMKDIEVIRSLGIAGLSFYPLMIHDKTPLAAKITDADRMDLADMEREYYLHDIIVNELAKDGFDFLELNKLVRNNLDNYEYMSLRHSVGSCVAIGEGAGGNIGEYYYKHSFEDSLVSDSVPICSKGRIVDPLYRVMDAFIYDLQKTKVDLAEYSNKLSINLENLLNPLIVKLEENAMLTRNGSIIKLTTKGRFWGNNIIDDLVRLILV